MTDAYYYESVHVQGTANIETIETLITSTEEEPKYIDGVAFYEDTATENHDAILGFYIEREKILDMPLGVTLESAGSSTRSSNDPFLPINQDLPVGQSLKVGHTSGTTASDLWYTVRYTIGK